MKRNIVKLGIFLFVSAVSVTSCYDDLLTFNEENNATGTGTGEYATELKSGEEIQGYLIEAEERVIDDREHKYQYQFSLHLDDFAGYMSLPHNFEGRISSSFAFNNDFASGPYANFQWVAQQVVPVMNTQKTLPQYKPLYAFAKLMFAQSAYNVAVVHGPVPFEDYRNLKETHPLEYESQSVVFTKILQYIDSAIVDIKEYQAKTDPEVDTYIVGTDKVTNSTDAAKIVSSWLKYANSMKLRIAMNLVKVDGFTYNGMTMQALAEEAVRDGVFEYGDYGIALPCGPDQTWGVHPLYKIANNWVDSRLNATFHNILLRTNHKFLEYYFVKNTGKLYNNRNQLVADNGAEFMSMRSGTYLRDKSNDQDYILYSRFTNNMQYEPIYWMKPEEVMFLRAEGALRGWTMGGEAKTFYEQGIKASFTEHGFSESDAEAYLSERGAGSLDQNSESYKKLLYVDYYDADNNLNESDRYFMLNNGYDPIDTNKYTAPCEENNYQSEKEILLEKIITQKWIALFPMSQLAWTDIRRTGYPRILPAVTGAYKDADGSISEETYIRRMPYSWGTSDEVKSEIETKAVPVLNADTPGTQQGDKQGTRLWWDVEKPNF